MSESLPPTSAPSLKPGDRLEKYDVLEQLGAGGASIVWKGHDALLDRYVAIKQLLIGVGQEEAAFRERFRAEADLLRKLGQCHPRVVRVIDLIDNERGVFIVTEFVNGPTLERVLSRSDGPVAAMQALRIVRSCALVLEAIHGQGVIHRDLKPGNLLLPRGGLKVCDAGLATLIAEQEAMSIGTARYMAPELLRGEPADGRADLYSLGVIGYEMLLGRAAFNEAFRSVLRDQRNTAMRWMKWHTNPRLRATPVHEIKPSLPPRLGDMIARLMEKDPAKRIASARQLIDTIDHHFDASGGDTSESEGVVVERDGAAPRSSSGTVKPSPTGALTGGREDTAALPRRRRWPMVVGLTAGVLAIGVLVGLFIQAGYRASMLEAHRAEGLDELARAEALYYDGDFAEARDAYASLASAWPGNNPIHRGSTAGLAFVEIKLALRAGRVDTAREALAKLVAMGHVEPDRVRDLRDEVDRYEQVSDALRVADEAIEAERIGEARDAVDGLRDFALTEDEADAVQGVWMRIEGTLQRRRLDAVLAEAERVREQEGDDAAIAYLTAEQERWVSPDLRARLDEWSGQRDRAAALERARAAEAAGDVGAAVLAYSEALRLGTDDELAARVALLKSDAALARGRALFEAGDEEGALVAFTRARSFADTPEARGWLARLGASRQKQTLVDAGDAAFARGEFALAVTQYDMAAQLDDLADPVLQGKLGDAQVMDLVQQARGFFDSEQYGVAMRIFEQARRLDPESSAVRQGLDRLRAAMRLREALAKGDAALSAGDYAAAREAYLRAQAIEDGAQVASRLDDLEYAHLLAQARSYRAALQWDAAEAVLKTALQVRDTETGRELMRAIMAREKASEEVGDAMR